MSPIKSIIKLFEDEATKADSQSDVCDSIECKEYFKGKRDGLNEAAQHLKNLQDLFR